MTKKTGPSWGTMIFVGFMLLLVIAFYRSCSPRMDHVTEPENSWAVAESTVITFNRLTTPIDPPSRLIGPGRIEAGSPIVTITDAWYGLAQYEKERLSESIHRLWQKASISTRFRFQETILVDSYGKILASTYRESSGALVTTIER